MSLPAGLFGPHPEREHEYIVAVRYCPRGSFGRPGGRD